MSATPILPLPREIEADSRCEAIRARLTTGERRTPVGAGATVPVLPFRTSLAHALGAARHAGQLVLGMAAATDALASEERGLAVLARRAGTARATRISRLLLLSEGGAAPLNRQAERLTALHAPRVLLALLACDPATLGLATTGRPAAVKVVLVRHKDAVAALLRALVAEERPAV